MINGLSFIISGLALGILGSFHCIGMCGPIALALPLPDGGRFTRLTGLLLYNGGRVVTYALLGAIMGLVGRQFYIGGWQQFFSIISGLLIILMVFYRSGKRWNFRIGETVQQGLGYWFSKKQFTSLFFIGVLNGLLPCGMVHIAIMASLTTARSISEGVLFMTGFGLATIPVMFSFAFFGTSLALPARNLIKRAIPYLAVCMGILLILRGLGLGIPYISPVIPHSPGAAILCHP